jgi:hypothetical protein
MLLRVKGPLCPAVGTMPDVDLYSRKMIKDVVKDFHTIKILKLPLTGKL